jgi:hypothetical protein
MIYIGQLDRSHTRATQHRAQLILSSQQVELDTAMATGAGRSGGGSPELGKRP